MADTLTSDCAEPTKEKNSLILLAEFNLSARRCPRSSNMGGYNAMRASNALLRASVSFVFNLRKRPMPTSWASNNGSYAAKCFSNATCLDLCSSSLAFASSLLSRLVNVYRRMSTKGTYRKLTPCLTMLSPCFRASAYRMFFLSFDVDLPWKD